MPKPIFRGEAIVSWQARGALSAGVMTLLELVHVLNFFPAVASDTLGFAWYVLHLFAVYLLVALPMVLIGAYTQGAMIRWIEQFNTPVIYTAVIGVAIALALFETMLAFFGEGQAPQFPKQMNDLQRMGFTLGMLLCVFVCLVGVYPAMKALLRRAPHLNAPTRAVAFVSFIVSVAAVFLGSFVLFSLHLDYLIPPLGVGAIALLMISFFCMSSKPFPRRPRRAISIFSLAVLVMLPIGPWRDPHSRFALYNHTPIAGAMATLLSASLDFDHDGTSAEWLGGTDCDELDEERNPTRRETVGDGIDQDCSGKDSSAHRRAATKVTSLMEGCRVALEKPNIILITIDALRHSAVTPRVMPNVENFSRFTTLFTRAYTAATFTDFSTQSMFASRSFCDIADANPLIGSRYCAGRTFTEELRAAGYSTAAYHEYQLSASVNRGFAAINAYPRPIDPPSHDVSKGDSALTSAHLTNVVIDFVQK